MTASPRVGAPATGSHPADPGASGTAAGAGTVAASAAVPSSVGAATSAGREPSAGMQLIGISKILGGRPVVQDMELTVPPGELICLLGPSGCGKTTTLRMIGGFIAPDSGTLQIGGRDYTHAPPEKRPTAMVFQNYALWPHMSVSANIGYGLKLRKLSKTEIAEKVDWALNLLNLSHHRETMPARISGGEQQRVALARALVLEPQVLLMDEPLSNLDAKLRVKVREDIREIQQRLAITTVLVTHDQDEALSVADRIAVMNGGRIEQIAAADDLYSSPRTEFVAGFVGAMNLIDGGPVRGGIAMPDGTVVPVDELTGATGDRIGVRPEAVRVTARDDPGSAPATVIRVVPRGHYREVVLACGGGELRAFTDDAPPIGTPVGVRVRRGLVYADGVLVRGSAE